MKLKHLTLLAFFLAVYAKDENSFSHGFGEDIEWVSWDSALELSQQQNKPVFMLIHKTWCGACKALKKNFNTSTKKKELVELSKKFIMVNLEDDEEPEDEKYAPDGAYIPRLFFLDKNGDLLEVDNKKNYPNNAYYFPQAVDVLKAMKRALIEFGGEVEESKEKIAEKVEAKEEKKEEVKKEKTEKKKEKEVSKKTKEEKKSESKKEKSEEKPKEEEVKKSKKEEKEKKDEPKKEKAKEEKKKEKGGEKKEEKVKKEEKADSKPDSKKQEQKKEKEGQKKEKKEKSEKTKGKKTEL